MQHDPRRIDDLPRPPKPVWSDQLRCLIWGGQRILRVSAQASSARAVLGEFERLGWPTVIPSPIRHCRYKVAAKRRRNAVYLLNKYQLTPDRREPVIEFHSLPGNRIAWVLRSPANGAVHAAHEPPAIHQPGEAP